MHVEYVEYVESLDEVDPAAWNRIADGAGLYQSHGWLSWAQRYYALPVRYLLVRDAAGSLRGALVAVLVETAPTRLITWYDPVRIFLAPHLDPALLHEAERAWYPVLLLGGCSGYQSELLVDPGLGPDRAQAVAGALLNAGARVAAELGARSRALMYASARSTRLAARHLPDAPVLPTSAQAEIAVGGGGGSGDGAGGDGGDGDDGRSAFEAYLSRFPSAKRSKLRRDADAFAASGHVIARHRLSAVLDEVVPLLAGHQRKHGDPVTDEQIGGYLRGQADFMDEQSMVFTDEYQGRIRGFTMCLTAGDTVHARVAGFAEDAAPCAYFNLAVYQPVRYAAELGARTVGLGAGSYATKKLRGAVNRPLYSVVVPPDPCPRIWSDALEHPTRQAVDAGIAVPTDRFIRHRDETTYGGA